MDVKEKLVEVERAAEWFEKRAENTPMPMARKMFELAGETLREKANGVTVQDGKDNDVPNKWIPVSEPPTEYRDKYGELIPFLVCLDGTEYPFRAMYDGKVWGDGWGEIPVTYWMPLPEPPKGE